MGKSASADIFFGIIVDDENNHDARVAPWLDEDGDGDFEEYAAEKIFAIIRPDLEYPDSKDLSDAAAAIRGKFSEYWKSRREALDDFPLEKDHVGYTDGSSVTVLRLRGWGGHVYDYGCEPVEQAALIVTDEHRKSFADAIEKLGIPNPPEPQIMLAATYG